MDLPELYHYGREGTWFHIWWFILYMVDGIYQVSGQLLSHYKHVLMKAPFQSAVVFFLILYAYVTPTARTDGFGVGLYEFSTVRYFSSW